MHGSCGDMAKMGCCRTEVRTDEYPQLAATAPPIDAHFAVIFWLSPPLADTKTVPSSLLRTPEEHASPGLVTAEITVLRI